MRPLVGTLATAAACVAVADWLFYDHPLGWTLGGYAIVVTTALAWRARRPVRPSRPALLLFFINAALAVSLVVEPGPLALSLLLLGLPLLAATLRPAESRGGDPLFWPETWRYFFGRGWLQAALDARTALRWRRRAVVVRRRGSVLSNWALPVLLTLGFLALFVMANPILERALSDFGGRVRESWRFLWTFTEPPRVLLWIVLFLWIWALLRGRPPRRDATNLRHGARKLIFSVAPIRRCLLLFNALFLVETCLDLAYLWGGAALPEGMTYAGYAHRGAYPLIVTALLAAAFVLITFRPGSESERDVWARRLVHLWIGQNVFLVASSVWRLWIYVEVFHLTRWRIAAGLWFFLVALGLLWIWLRIARRRSGEWLIRRNAFSAAALLLACSFMNFDGWIAWYNVRHCREVSEIGAAIDLKYLRHLGVEVLPALRWFVSRLDELTETREEAREIASKLEVRLETQLADWRGWSFLRQRLRNGVEG